MKKATAGAITVATATALWWGSSSRKPKPKPISADSAAALASLDSFPTIVPRDTLGRRSVTLQVGQGTVLCALSRNRYTGEVRIVVPLEATVDDEAYLATVCERARLLFAGERSS